MADIQDVRWQDESETGVTCLKDGKSTAIVEDLDNTDWQEIDRRRNLDPSDPEHLVIAPAPVESPPTDEERIDAAFPQTDVARVLFEALFEIANDVRILKGQATITKAQLRDWLKAKLP